MKISQRAVDLLKKHEGLPTAEVDGVRLAVPYKDPIGIWTIGYGFIRMHGKRVTGHTPAMTMLQVEEQLVKQIVEYKEGAENAVTVEINPDQLGALTSFAWNLGVPALRSSTLLKRINSCAWDDVEYQFSRWNKAGGKVFKGLVTRRQDEADLFLRGTIYDKVLTAPVARECTSCYA